MHIHISRVRRNGKTYEYAELVESYRRPRDGMPVQRVLAKLGRLDTIDIDNLRTALRASRRGERVVLDRRQLPADVSFSKPLQNLRYLDVAVLVELWRELGLDTVLAKLLPVGEADVAPADVVAALTIQRCVDPGSKLYAERWFPRTALPELLGIEPKKFNNTRLHRILEQVDGATPGLMRELPKLYRRRQGDFVSLFLDVTDTWFVGHGPELAQRAKTKEGLVERKIGIVLLCNERGLPVRWQVIAGKQGDAPAMHDLLAQVRGVEWVGNAPVVCDRSMGTTSEIRKLLRTKLQFVTALKVTEFGSYGAAIPQESLSDLEPSPESPDACEADPCVLEASRRVMAAGMQQVSSTLYVLDLGIVERDAPIGATAKRAVDHVGRAMRLTQQIQSMVDNGGADSFASAIRRLGVSRHAAKWYRRLQGLEPSIQQEVLDGKAASLSISKLTELAAIDDAEQQRHEYETLLVNAKPPAMVPASSASDTEEASEEDEETETVKVRAVVSFNPELFVDQRRKAQQELVEVQAYVRELNLKLAQPRCHRTTRQIEKELDRMLSRKSLLDVFRLEVGELSRDDGSTHHVANAELDVTRWQRRRRYDGFCLIIGHPELPHAAADLCRLYRDKDAVEKDFQIIKSLVKLRPVRHHTAAKVRAHVTLCMLSLMLERTLSERLKEKLKSPLSAAMALEQLSTCCLNRFGRDDGKSSYLVTHPDDDQKALLRALRLDHLADDDAVAERVLPR